MLTITEIRDQLNGLAFKDGKRQVELGEVSDLFDGEDVNHAVERFDHELQTHDLELVREGDKLIVVQRLKKRPQDYSWIAKGIQWASRITAIAAEMVVPGLLGFWLDDLWVIARWFFCYRKWPTASCRWAHAVDSKIDRIWAALLLSLPAQLAPTFAARAGRSPRAAFSPVNNWRHLMNRTTKRTRFPINGKNRRSDSTPTESMCNVIPVNGQLDWVRNAKPLFKPPGLDFVGVVSAGVLHEVFEQTERIDFNAMFANDPCFVLQVCGESMIEARIFDGDYVIVKQSETATAGQSLLAPTMARQR